MISRLHKLVGSIQLTLTGRSSQMRLTALSLLAAMLNAKGGGQTPAAAQPELRNSADSNVTDEYIASVHAG